MGWRLARRPVRNVDGLVCKACHVGTWTRTCCAEFHDVAKVEQAAEDYCLSQIKAYVWSDSDHRVYDAANNLPINGVEEEGVGCPGFVTGTGRWSEYR